MLASQLPHSAHNSPGIYYHGAISWILTWSQHAGTRIERPTNGKVYFATILAKCLYGTRLVPSTSLVPPTAKYSGKPREKEYSGIVINLNREIFPDNTVYISPLPLSNEYSNKRLPTCLDSWLWNVNIGRQLLSHHNIWVMCLWKCIF